MTDPLDRPIEGLRETRCSCALPDGWWGADGWHWVELDNGTPGMVERCAPYWQEKGRRVSPYDRTKLEPMGGV